MSKNKTYIILILISLLMLFSIGTFLYLFNEVKVKNENASLMTKTLDKKNMQKKDLVNLERTIDETKKQREVLQSYLLDESKIDEFIGWLEDQGGPVDAKIVVNSVGRTNGKDAFNVTLTASGSFNSVLNLSYLFENSNYKINIEKMFLSKNIQDGGENGDKIEFWQNQITFSIVSKGDELKPKE